MVIDPGAAQWPYQQVAARVRAEVEAGGIGPRLPSHMDLAERYGVAEKTVARALALLRAEGLIYTVPGLGTFTAPPDEAAPRRP